MEKSMTQVAKNTSQIKKDKKKSSQENMELYEKADHVIREGNIYLNSIFFHIIF